MGGEKPRQRHFLIDPLGVVTRRSTDILAVEDRLVARTMTFIQSGRCPGIRVRDVVNDLEVCGPVLKLASKRPWVIRFMPPYGKRSSSGPGA